jgi:hypothetical protein
MNQHSVYHTEEASTATLFLKPIGGTLIICFSFLAGTRGSTLALYGPVVARDGPAKEDTDDFFALFKHNSEHTMIAWSVDNECTSGAVRSLP